MNIFSQNDRTMSRLAAEEEKKRKRRRRRSRKKVFELHKIDDPAQFLKNEAKALAAGMTSCGLDLNFMGAEV